MSEKRKVHAKIIKYSSVEKSDVSQNISNDEASSIEWLVPSFTLEGLGQMAEHSSIILQCVDAYKKNIAGFGIGVRYKSDLNDTKPLEEEFNKLTDIVELLSFEHDTKEIFEQIIELREIYGIAYLEVIRNLKGDVVEIECVEDVPSIEKSIKGELTECEYFYKGEAIKRKKRFRRYRQNINGKTVYFKEFGDKRIMDKSTGEYTNSSIPIDAQANEILEFKLGSSPYGQVRWIGQTIGIDGSRKAENLNNNYFENGRHTPLAVIVNNGTLTDESFDKIKEYMNDIKGENGQHSFLLLEGESNSDSVDYEKSSNVSIEIKSLADILQHDELFQDYLNNNRKKVQSSFRLPDLYVGYTNDFNRATAQTAVEVTEEQVFQTERQSLAWIINNKLLNEYGFKHVEVYFKEPNISNPDDLYKILTVCNNAGGFTPNKAKEVLYNALGDVSDDFKESWGNIPLAFQKINGDENTIAKSDNSDEIMSVLKSVNAFLYKEGKNE